MLLRGLPHRWTSAAGARRRGTAAATGAYSDVLTRRRSQPNRVIWRLNNSDAALKR
jgi:hypothetical protein